MRKVLCAAVALAGLLVLPQPRVWSGEGVEPCVRHFHAHHAYEGADLYFNCGCNGSYKFPVPPLYTYHWPGMYSQQLMTDYHSPWRFPPLKPYRDEPDPVDESVRRLEAVLRPVAAETPLPATGVSRGWKSMSERMLEQTR